MLCLIFGFFEAFVGASHYEALALAVERLLRHSFGPLLCLVEAEKHGACLAFLGFVRNNPLVLSVRGEACPVYVFLDAHDDFPAHRVAFLRRSISRFHFGLVPFRLFLSSHAVSLLLACPQGLLFSLGVVR